ncbi:MAG: oxaloacetate decarboxylase subunit alpha, partial [Clostridiales bacterium]|nr:oxaloacetate decarboxylase subunit alpha [Clostridiales bacterium]
VILNPKVLKVAVNALIYQVPGGMLSNLISQLKQQNASDRLTEVLEEVPRVRADLGYPPLVTPSSQIVGTQAVLNVLMGERYKTVTKETKGVLAGEYGRLPIEPDAKIVKKIIGDTPRITCRPADNIAPELDKYKKEIEEYAIQEEDVLTYALFPQLAIPFFKKREAKLHGVDKTICDKDNLVQPI